MKNVVLLLKIKDLNNDKIYSNDMSNQNTQSILSINFCTSYTEVEVQDEIDNGCEKSFPSHTVILPPYGILPEYISWVDLIAIQKDARGEWVFD